MIKYLKRTLYKETDMKTITFKLEDGELFRLSVKRVINDSWLHVGTDVKILGFEAHRGFEMMEDELVELCDQLVSLKNHPQETLTFVTTEEDFYLKAQPSDEELGKLVWEVRVGSIDVNGACLHFLITTYFAGLSAIIDEVKEALG